MDKLNKIIAENIAFLRTTNKMTQAELAQKLNYSDKAVSKWERGDSIPDVRVLLNIASIFGVNINYLLEDHGLEELPIIPKKKVNYKVVSVMSLVGVWTAALLAFLLCNIITGAYIFDIFVYTLPATIIMLLVFNNLWGERRKVHNFFIISALWWDILLTLWYVFPPLVSMLWLGIPVQIIIALGFQIIKKRR